MEHPDFPSFLLTKFLIKSGENVAYSLFYLITDTMKILELLILAALGISINAGN